MIYSTSLYSKDKDGNESRQAIMSDLDPFVMSVTNEKSVFIPKTTHNKGDYPDVRVFTKNRRQLNESFDFGYTGSSQALLLPAGTYFVQCWGADGGDHANGASFGGHGGYASAVVSFNSSTFIDVFVGGRGNDGTMSGGTRDGGWNGGGNKFYLGQSGTGGGASDIRVGGTGLSNRIIVAGGGGGTATGSNGGNGGGYIGGSGNSGSGTSVTGGGTQTAGGAADMGAGGQFATAGTLGVGGTGTGNSGGSGGGGYYGGGGGGFYKSGGGGSSYIASHFTDRRTGSYGEAVYVTKPVSGGNGFVRIMSYLDADWSVKTFSYTGTQETVILPAGRFTIECWGADGGYNPGGTIASASTTAGRNTICSKGGYSRGTLEIFEPTVLVITVGGAGSYSGTTSQLVSGGYNGGGSAYTSNWGRGSGGGASDVRIGGITLDKRVIVAGGGGGNTGTVSGMTQQNIGGHGGGDFGQDGIATAGTSPVVIGTGATMSAPGQAVSYSFLIGSFGMGGSANSASGANAAGGGGGYYGGAAGNTAGGGSGYVGGLKDGHTIQYGQGGFIVNPSGNNNGYVRITLERRFSGKEELSVDVMYKSDGVLINSEYPFSGEIIVRGIE